MLLHIVWQVPAKHCGVARKAELTLLSVIAQINLRRRAHIKA